MLRTDGDQLAVLWTDLRSSSASNPREMLWLSTSPDAGQTWAPEVQVEDSAAGSARSAFPAMALQGGLTHVVWEEWRAGNADVYYRGLEVAP